MRWNYPPLDINPIFTGLRENIISLSWVIIIIFIFIIIFIIIIVITFILYFKTPLFVLFELLSMYDLLLPHNMNGLIIFWVLFGRTLMKK